MFGTLDRTSPAVVGVLSPTANTIQKGVEVPYVYIANGKMNPLGDIPEEIEKVCNEYPNLTGHGLKKYKEDSVHQLPNPNGVQLCMRWLLENDGLKRRITINTKRSSYGWKHIVEKSCGEYVSNGEFICAALLLGYKMKHPAGSPNAYFNIKEQDAVRK